MKLTKIAGTCDDGPCPTVYHTDRGTLAVQGATIGGVTVPDHEQVVEVPFTLVYDTARALGWIQE